MKKLGLLLTVLISSQLFAQVTGQPFFFETANGAKNIHITGHRLVWQNPDSTLYNKIYFGDDSILVSQQDPTTLLYDGFPSTVYDTIYLTSVEPLQWYKKYYWIIVEYYNNSIVLGPSLNFKTMPYPWCNEDIHFVDDFESGLGNWEITNDGGTCIWELHNAYEYTISPPANGKVIAADADYCGSGTTLLSTATLLQPFNFSNQGVCRLEFDNDWNAWDSTSFGFIEISEDQINWTIVKTYNHIDIRNTHEIIEISSFIQGEAPMYIRLRSVQPGWHWWWAIDNFEVIQHCQLTQFYPPHNLLLNLVDGESPAVELSWSRGQFADLFNIYRKDGLPTDSSSYSIIGTVGPNTTTFIDTTVQNEANYTYRVLFMNAGSSNEATVYLQSIVPVELISFTSSVSENNVTLNWQTATETNNSGFEIQRLKDSKIEKLKNWEGIGFVNGNGTTTEPQSYSFVDKNLEAGKYQYRLKQLDFDGTFEYSNTIEVEINPPAKFSLEQNYPNPFNPSTKISFVIPNVVRNLKDFSSQTPRNDNAIVTLKVYDVLGKEVATLVNEEKPAGSYEVEFDAVKTLHATSLPSGIYFYQLKAGEFVETKKMILLK